MGHYVELLAIDHDLARSFYEKQIALTFRQDC